MNHRERTLTAIRHQEPDRLPIDFGGSVITSISAYSYQALRRALGLPISLTRIVDPMQYIAGIDEDVLQCFDVDTRPVFLQPYEWRTIRMRDGSEAEYPARFQPRLQADGSQVILDAKGIVVSKMPADGYYFDTIHAPLQSINTIQEMDEYFDLIRRLDLPAYFDMSFTELAEQARSLRQKTDALLLGQFGAHILNGALSLRGWDTFLMDLASDKDFAHALLGRILDVYLERFSQYAETVGKYLDVLVFLDDLGHQDRPMLRPVMYREMIKPYHRRLVEFVKSHCQAFVMLHSDGAIAPLIPDLIEAGFDILNPVQVSAHGMQPAVLKREYGKDITFWGAGCDPQQVLPFENAQKVSDETKRMIDLLAPGGGYVFGSIHNIQAEVPVENVIAMFRTALEYGRY